MTQLPLFTYRDAERLKVAEELIAKVTRAADRKNAPITEVRSILEAGRVKMELMKREGGGMKELTEPKWLIYIYGEKKAVAHLFIPSAMLPSVAVPSCRLQSMEYYAVENLAFPIKGVERKCKNCLKNEAKLTPPRKNKP